MNIQFFLLFIDKQQEKLDIHIFKFNIWMFIDIRNLIYRYPQFFLGIKIYYGYPNIEV